jgi:putative glutamine amidotransferase
MKPLIGITGRSVLCEDIDFIPKRLAGTRVDLHFRDYALRVAEADGVPVQLTSSADPHELMNRLDGVVLSGGSDIGPDRYGRTPEPELGVIDPDRDSFEWAILQMAVQRGTPVFGICRGLQLINVFFGGTLNQDLGLSRSLHDGPHTDPEYRFHEVTMVEDTLGSLLYGTSVDVTSAHHQSIQRLGEGLVAAGHAHDGTVEIVESTRHPILGVQWHAEWGVLNDPGFHWLVESSTAREGS